MKKDSVECCHVELLYLCVYIFARYTLFYKSTNNYLSSYLNYIIQSFGLNIQLSFFLILNNKTLKHIIAM